jgi:hypothetical protein
MDFVQRARALLTRFQNTPELYPKKERNKQFTGFRNKVIQERSENLQKFQGLKFDEWFQVFVYQAVVLSHARRSEDAQECLKSAMDSIVFYQDEGKRIRLWLHSLGKRD